MRSRVDILFWSLLCLETLAACGRTSKAGDGSGRPHATGGSAGQTGTEAGAPAAETGGSTGASVGSGATAGTDAPGSAGGGADAGGSDTLDGLVPLYAPSDAVNPPIVIELPDGTLLTRAAGRVRSRHEKESTFGTYTPGYFQNRSFGLMIEDFTQKGEKRIRVTYLPLAAPAQQGVGQTTWKGWKQHANNSTFQVNDYMQDVATSSLPFTGPHDFIQQYDVSTVPDMRSMERGQVLEFELSVFIDPQDLMTPAGRTSYYTDTFRYVIGVGGLTPNNTDFAQAPGPLAQACLGGATTISWLFNEPDLYFSQTALNIQHENVQAFLEGRRLFYNDFITGESAEEGMPRFTEQALKAGPLVRAPACSDCHVKNGSGPAVEGFADGRVARSLVGVGLLEAIDEATILGAADRLDRDGDGISGRPSYVKDPVTGSKRLGRLGSKAETISVAHQVAKDAFQAIGVGTSLYPDNGNVELADGDFAKLVTYASLLGAPPQRVDSDPRVMRGEAVFGAVGCGSCHKGDLVTGQTHPFSELRAQSIRPFTDLLLHDLGPDLADDSGVEAGGEPDSPPAASEWRTAPLWGIGLRETVNGHTALMHDGRAATVLEAALMHGGEAQQVSANLKALPEDDQAALVAFVLSL
jgi:CxxC motif-containing protein (DUF1111 family)